MTVAELIEALRAMPQDLQVGYFNRCADDGTEFAAVDEARYLLPGHYHGNYPKVPEPGAVVLE